jgi:hypothetical protein
MPVILATQEAEIRRIVKSSQTNSSVRPYLKTPFTKKGLVEWLKVKALNSSPSSEKKKKKLKRSGAFLLHFLYRYVSLL